MNFSNATLWDALRAKYPDFARITSKATAETFTEKGWGEISRNNINALNQFFQLSMRVAFNKLDIARVNTRLEESGLAEVYGSHNGGYLQRIAIETISPVSPKYLNLENGISVDPYVVRKPEAKERFFECGNFNYQSLITIQDWQVKTIFLEEYGMSNFIAGIMAGLENGYRMQKELNIYKAIHECINSTSKPLQATQKITLATWNDFDVTDAQLMDFVANVQDIATEMETAITQPGFNANGFDTACNPEDFVLLVRAGIMNKIRRQLRLGAFNPEDLALPFKILEVQDFGGITYHLYDGTHLNKEVRVYPLYDKMGAVVKGSYTNNSKGIIEDPLTDFVYKDTDFDVQILDLDANVLGVVAQKGLIFEEIKEPYTVRPIQNPAGLYENYWASAPNNMIRYDANYGCIVIEKPLMVYTSPSKLSIESQGEGSVHVSVYYASGDYTIDAYGDDTDIIPSVTVEGNDLTITAGTVSENTDTIVYVTVEDEAGRFVSKQVAVTVTAGA